MSNVSEINGTSTGRTSTKKPGEPTDKGGTSEADYLKQQAEEATAAIKAAVSELTATLGHAIDPRALAKKHPFIAVGSAVAVTFAAAAIAIPSKRQQELRRLQKIQEALHPAPKPAADAKPADPKATAKQPIWMSLLHEVFQVARPILTAAITANLAKSPASSPPDTAE